jgi:hypothetical protein
MVVAGAATIAGGVVMVVLNRPYAVVDRPSSSVSLLPLPGGGMVAVAGAL